MKDITVSSFSLLKKKKKKSFSLLEKQNLTLEVLLHLGNPRLSERILSSVKNGSTLFSCIDYKWSFLHTKPEEL